MRAQYIDTKEIKLVNFIFAPFFLFFMDLRCRATTHYVFLFIIFSSLVLGRILVGTWNVGGSVPPNDLDIEDWLGKQEQADMYVLG